MLRRLRNHAKPACSSAGAVHPVSMQLRCGFRTGSTWLLHGFNTISTVELVLEPCAEDLLKPSKAAANRFLAPGRRPHSLMQLQHAFNTAPKGLTSRAASTHPGRGRRGDT